jgi:hypothetical protein
LTLLGDHTKEVVVGLVYGIVLFIVSEAFAFLSIFWAFFHSSLSPAIELGGIWPWLIIFLFLIIRIYFYKIKLFIKNITLHLQNLNFLFIIFIVIFILCTYLLNLFEFYTNGFMIINNLNILTLNLFASKLNISSINQKFREINSFSLNDNLKKDKIKKMSDYLNISLEEVKTEFDKLSKEFNPSNFNISPYEFKSFINRLFQAEGYIRVMFRGQNSLKLRFLFSIGQNYTPDIAKVLLLLQYYLDGIGTFKFVTTNVGNKHIKYVIGGKKALIYGEKKFAFSKLDQICKIINETPLYVGTDHYYKMQKELIQLVYSLNPEGKVRNLSLNEKLAQLNCINLDKENIFIKNVIDQPFKWIKENDNLNLPNIQFIIGLFLGDGSLYFSISENKNYSSVFYFKIVCEIVSLKNTETNKHLIKLVAKTLGISNYIYTNSNLIFLKCSGSYVFKKILPLFQENKQLLFWKESQVKLGLNIGQLVENKNHLTKEGLKQIIEILYSVPNNYSKSKDYWLNLIEVRKWKEKIRGCNI